MLAKASSIYVKYVQFLFSENSHNHVYVASQGRHQKGFEVVNTLGLYHFLGEEISNCNCSNSKESVPQSKVKPPFF